MKCNGQSPVTIKPIHGKFGFPNQWFAARTSNNQFSWLEYPEQFRDGYESERLRSRCCYYANRMSYHEVATLLKDATGVALVSGQRIHAIVVEEATRLSVSNATGARMVLEANNTFPPINQEVAIYDARTEEVLRFDDGLQVKKQKEHREKPSARASATEPLQKHERGEKLRKEKVNTDVLMLQRAQGGFRYLMEGLDGIDADGERVSAEELVKSAVIEEYGEQKEALNLVAITDGARTIRLFFECVFGLVIVLILDWYHLEKNVWDLMSMIAWNKAEKETHCRALLTYLWEGNVNDATGTKPFLELRIFGVVVGLGLLLGIQVIQIAEEFVETVIGGQMLVLVAQVVLAKLPCHVSLLLQQVANRRRPIRNTVIRAGHPNGQQTGTEGVGCSMNHRSPALCQKHSPDFLLAFLSPT